MGLVFEAAPRSILDTYGWLFLGLDEELAHGLDERFDGAGGLSPELGGRTRERAPFMNAEVTVENLRAGIGVWRKKRWETDFADALYGRQEQLLAGGVTDLWWRQIVPVLSAWKAIRPRSRAEILARGLSVLAELNAAHGRLQAVSVDNIEWEVLEDLFHVAWSIKGVNSPVFASKLCHFMRPDLYVVVDGDAVGIQAPYPEYWKACWTAWRAAEPLHAKLCDILNEETGATLRPTFPFATKIPELCVIGARARGAAI
jgi:hypothetical protein